MPSSSSVLDDARDLLRRRLAELEDERTRLERALRELGAKTARRGPGRPPGSKAAKPTRRRRRRRSGGRADQAMNLVAKKPGITAKEIAETLKIKPNYLYRALSELGKDKKVRKQGRKYFPVG